MPEYEALLAQETLIFEATEEICRVMEGEDSASAITRKELAERLGRSKGFVTQLLSGTRNMTLRTLADIAGALDRKVMVRLEPTAAPPGEKNVAEGGSVQCGGVALAQLPPNWIATLEHAASLNEKNAAEWERMGLGKDEQVAPHIAASRGDAAVLRAIAAFLTPQSSGGQEADLPCPDANVCQRCPASHEDDVCLPRERKAAEEKERSGGQQETTCGGSGKVKRPLTPTGFEVVDCPGCIDCREQEGGVEERPSAFVDLGDPTKAPPIKERVAERRALPLSTLRLMDTLGRIRGEASDIGSGDPHTILGVIRDMADAALSEVAFTQPISDYKSGEGNG